MLPVGNVQEMVCPLTYILGGFWIPSMSVCLSPYVLGWIWIPFLCWYSTGMYSTPSVLPSASFLAPPQIIARNQQRNQQHKDHSLTMLSSREIRQYLEMSSSSSSSNDDWHNQYTSAAIIRKMQKQLWNSDSSSSDSFDDSDNSDQPSSKKPGEQNGNHGHKREVAMENLC